MKDVYFVNSLINDLKRLYPTIFLKDTEFNQRLSEFKDGSFSYFCVDLQGMNIKNAKCYLRGKNYNSSSFYDKPAKSEHEWCEYSFSIVNSAIKSNPEERKIAYRLKPMPLDEGRQFVYDIFKKYNAESHFTKYDDIAEIIIHETKTKRYPIGGVGFTFDAEKNKSLEIKLYYTLMHFAEGTSEFCDNDGAVREKAFAKVSEYLQSKQIIDHKAIQIINIMEQHHIPISLLGFNDQIENDSNTAKLYYRKGTQPIKEHVLQETYQSLFGISFDTKLQAMHELVVQHGLSLSEICLVQNKRASTLKICYET